MVRAATLADAPVVVEFNRLLAEESEGKTLDTGLLSPGVKAALADPRRARYFVASEQSAVLGQIMVTFEWSDWRNGWIWWIQSVYVRKETRRRGVFRALFNHVQRQAQEEKVVGLRLYVEENNLVAQETYRRLGMRPAGYFVLEKCPL
jgi:ribosomal protein S18 acetylase RimI-like enzyme